jgi:hypothetical protein
MVKAASPEKLAVWRKQLLARLAAERASLLRQYNGLAAETLCTLPVNEQGWTAKDQLTLVAFWDAFYAQQITLVLDGRKAELQLPTAPAAAAALDRQALVRFQSLPLDEALALCLKERRGFLAVLETIPDPILHRRLRPGGTRQTTLRTWVRSRFLHDAACAATLQRWRTTLPTGKVTFGSRPLLQALLRATWQEWAAAVALLPLEERSLRPVRDGVTLLELIRRLTGWATFGVRTLARLAEGPIAFPVTTATYQSFDAAISAANQETTWDSAWVACRQAQKSLVAQIAAAPEPALATPFVTPWGTATTGYRFVTFCGTQPGIYAADLRRTLAIPNLPRRLQHHPLPIV